MGSWFDWSNWFWSVPTFEPVPEELMKFLNLLEGFTNNEIKRAANIWHNLDTSDKHGEYTNFLEDVKWIVDQDDKSNQWKLKHINIAADNIKKWHEDWAKLAEDRRYGRGWDKPWPPKLKKIRFTQQDKCMAMLCADGIITRATFRKWLVLNHPDHCGKDHSPYKSIQECQEAKKKLWIECQQKLDAFVKKNLTGGKKQYRCPKKYTKRRN